MTYKPEDIDVMLTPEAVMEAFDDGTIETRVNGIDVEICFPADDDPGCQINYIASGCDEEEWESHDDYDQARIVIDALRELVEEDPDTYGVQVSNYVDQILGV